MLRSIFNPKSITAIILIAGVLFISKVNNPRDARSGAPSEGTCADAGCHVGNHSLNGTIEISGLPDVIETDSTYRLKILMTNPNGRAAKGGFQLVTLGENNDSIGIFSNLDLSSTKTTVANRIYWEHNPSKNFDTQNTVEFLCDWTAPSEVGDAKVKLYCSAVISDGNTAASGDLVLDFVDSFSIKVGLPNLSAEFVDKVHVDCYGNENGMLSIEVMGGLPPYSYNWSHGATDSSVVGLTDAIYWVTVTDQKMDSIELRTRIFQPDSIIIIQQIKNVSCPGESDGEVNFIVSGGNSPYSYEWPGGLNVNPRINLFSGLYNVTITDAINCSRILEIAVSQPVFFITRSQFITKHVSCFGNNDGSIDLSPGISSTANYSYSWNTGAMTEKVSNLGSGRYFVTISNESLCEEVFAFSIVQPGQLEGSMLMTDVSIKGGSDGVIQANITGGNSPFEYMWSNGQTTSRISGISAGEYRLTVTDENACEGFFTAILEEPDCNIQILEDIFSVSCFAECDGMICPRVRNADFPVTYSWNNGATDSCISFLCKGAYRLTVTDGQDCEIIVNFGVNEPTELRYSLIITDNICFGESDGALEYNLTGGTPPYRINPSNTNNLSNGVYSVTLSDANNCSFIVRDTVSSPGELGFDLITKTDPDMGENSGEIDVQSYGGTRPFIFFWIDQDGFSVSNQEDLISVPNGCYTLTIIDANGCNYIAEEICLGPVGVNENLAQSLKIHPNPFREFIKIESSTSISEAYIRIYTSKGELIDTRTISNGFNSTSILNSSQWSKGIYFIEVTTKNGHFAKKLVKLD